MSKTKQLKQDLDLTPQPLKPLSESETEKVQSQVFDVRIVGEGLLNITIGYLQQLNSATICLQSKPHKEVLELINSLSQTLKTKARKAGDNITVGDNA